MRLSVLATLLVSICSLGACSTTDRATHFEGLTSPEGGQITHFNTTNIGLNFLFALPIAGDAELDDAVHDMSLAAKSAGCTKIRVVQSDSTNYWWVLPPFTFILSPVVANAAGDATK